MGTAKVDSIELYYEEHGSGENTRPHSAACRAECVVDGLDEHLWCPLRIAPESRVVIL